MDFFTPYNFCLKQFSVKLIFFEIFRGISRFQPFSNTPYVIAMYTNDFSDPVFIWKKWFLWCSRQSLKICRLNFRTSCIIRCWLQSERPFSLVTFGIALQTYPILCRVLGKGGYSDICIVVIRRCLDNKEV